MDIKGLIERYPQISKDLEKLAKTDTETTNKRKLYIICLLTGYKINSSHCRVVSFFDSPDDAINYIEGSAGEMFMFNGKKYPYAAIAEVGVGSRFYGMTIDPADVLVYKAIDTETGDPSRYEICEINDIHNKITDMVIAGV